MKNSFPSFNPARLMNASHLAFHAQLLRVISRSLFLAIHQEAKYDAFVLAHKAEGAATARKRGTVVPATKQVQEAFAQSHTLLAYLCQTIQSAQHLCIPAMAGAANRLWVVARTVHKLRHTYANLNTHVGQLAKTLLEDKWRADLDTLQLRPVVEALNEKIALFSQARQQQTDQQSRKIAATPAKKARRAADIAAKELLTIINMAMVVYTGPGTDAQLAEQFLHTVKKINSIIQNMKQGLAHHQGKITLARKKNALKQENATQTTQASSQTQS